MHTQTLPQVYIVPSSPLNGGYGNQGFWISACQPPRDVRIQISMMIKNFYHDQSASWVIKDFKNFQNIQIVSDQPLEEICEIADMLRWHGTAYALYLKHLVRPCKSLEDFEDCYQGGWDSKADFIAHLEQEIGQQWLESITDIDLGDSCWQKLIRIYFEDHFVVLSSSPTAYHVFRRD